MSNSVYFTYFYSSSIACSIIGKYCNAYYTPAYPDCCITVNHISCRVLSQMVSLHCLLTQIFSILAYITSLVSYPSPRVQLTIAWQVMPLH